MGSSSRTRFGTPIVPAGMLTPTPRKQVAALGLVTGRAALNPTMGTGVFAAQKARQGLQLYRTLIGPITSVMSAYHSVESFRKIRGGGYKPAYSITYTPYDPSYVPPLPYFGRIPIIKPGLEIGAEPIESRGGEHTSRSGTPKTRPSMRGPSATTRLKKRSKTQYRYFRRDEDRYNRRRSS